MIKIIFSIFILLVISGCLGKKSEKLEPIDSTKKPVWIDNPQKYSKVGDKIFGLGSAREHVKGIRHQRLLAISSAVNEIAQQKGVKVYNELETMVSVQGDKSSKSSQMYSKQTVDGKTINAKIAEIWVDKIKKEIFVLMISE